MTRVKSTKNRIKPVTPGRGVLIFRSALLSILPVMDKAHIPWKDGEAYDEWDEISQTLYRNIVSRSLQWALNSTDELDTILPHYNMKLSSYRDKSVLQVSGPGVSGIAVFVGFSSDNAPLTPLQQESFTRQIKTQIEAVPRHSARPQPDLVHPKGEPTELQKESIERQQEAKVKVIPRKSARPRSGVDCLQVEKSLLQQWARKRPKEKKAAQQQGQGGDSLAPQMPASRRNGAVLSDNTKTTGGRLSRKKNPIQVELCGTGRNKQLRLMLKREFTTKVKPNQYPWLDDYCGIGRHQRLQAMLKRESETNAQWSTNRVQSGWCGNERTGQLEALRWKLENNQTFEQPLGWISETRESYQALQKLCSRGKCHHLPDNTRGTNVAPTIPRETAEKLLYPSGSPHSDETKREIQKAEAEGTIIGAGIGSGPCGQGNGCYFSSWWCSCCIQSKLHKQGASSHQECSRKILKEHCKFIKSCPKGFTC